MKIHFYGVRGSIPTPITSQQIQAKISSAIQRVTVADVASQDARERFLCNLPQWLFGTAGGNTACVLLTSSAGKNVILDAGSGLRVLGKSDELKAQTHFDFFLSHFHYDHIQGLPFFDPAFRSDTTFDFYSCFPQTKEYLFNHQHTPYFPIPFDVDNPRVTFHTLCETDTFLLDTMRVFTCPMQHPGGSNSFAFCEGGKKFVYATDAELVGTDFVKDIEHERVFAGADVVVLDAQYTAEEFYKKESWGHSSFCYAVDFANFWGIKNLYLFHHEPMYDDKKLYSIVDAANWYAKHVVHSGVNVYLCVEGQEVQV